MAPVQSSSARTVNSILPDSRRIVVVISMLMTSLFLLCLPSSTTNAFPTNVVGKPRSVSKMMMAVVNADDEIAKQLARAKALLEKSKAKIEAKQTQSLVRDDDYAESNNNRNKTPTKSNSQSAIPFFASRVAVPAKPSGTKREKVVKATNDDGLVTIDGDLMAKLSETEEWEIRSLHDVFENETKNFRDPIAERDVAASIFGLQRVLQTEDFQRIFDKRNRFIGEQ